VKDEDVLTEYSVNLHDAYGSYTNWKVHRLLQIQRHSSGDPFVNSEVVQTHFDLKPGQLFETTASFLFTPMTERGIRAMMNRFSYLKRRGWEKLEFGELTDVDHMAGRSKLWMNSTLFTSPCIAPIAGTNTSHLSVNYSYTGDLDVGCVSMAVVTTKNGNANMVKRKLGLGNGNN
jgi:hypothetical protein